ncbi:MULTISPECIES: KAP family P-loop NTPase fold protein [Pectobacterium]|uniref:KAP family P-loop NTPase fold protein n=1 Tax=Pectobacterium TaxID=122277 RepID=UPI001304CE0D|nr:P-loop NTPase fold protein [Pectobacterium versatile]
MRTTSAHSAAGNDSPVLTPEEDRYGFVALAKELSHSIISLDRTISTVIGIEGQWGTGKTSLLNLLLRQMEHDRPVGTHVLKISPWLTPSGDGAVEGLLLPVAAILDEEEAKGYTGFRKIWHKCRRAKASPLASSMLSYAQQASGRLAPLAELAGNWVPGAGIAAGALKSVSTADLSARRQTTAELRTDIEKRIAALGLNFIVVLDDLDRLEPDQAVEVLRMIRSVADFSGFHYVICYDPVVLSHAVKRGLGVEDGRLYLQKIVPLSFKLPRPEPFDLRREFLIGVTELYANVNGTQPNDTLLSDLKSVTETFGATLSTPRDVRMALGSLTFRYESLREYIWFPDLCLLQLLRVTLPGLYDWVERYLAEYGTVTSGEGRISKKESYAMVKELRELLSSLPAVSPLSVMDMGHWFPGITGLHEDSVKLFNRDREEDNNARDADKRLSSSLYWRYYFAFTPPKNVLPPSFFDNLFRLAGNVDDNSELVTLLFDQMVDNGFSSHTWFEHILDRLNTGMIIRATPGQCRGLLGFVFQYGDDIITRYRARGEWLTIGDFGLKEFADRLLRRLCSDNRQDALDYLSSALKDENTFHWSLSYLRHQLWQNGLAGNRPAYEQDRILSDSELNILCATTSVWLESPDNDGLLRGQEDLSSLVYAWREISSPDAVATWLRSVTQEDEDFLRVLLRLRYDGISSDIGRYQGLNLSAIAELFKGDNVIRERLDTIGTAGDFPDLVKQVRKAIAYSQRT